MYKQQQLAAYKADLAKQIDYKTRLERTFKFVHPRQPVPFDVKHMPGAWSKVFRRCIVMSITFACKQAPTLASALPIRQWGVKLLR